MTLTPTFNPSNTTNKIVTWSSSDESVATVDNAGKVTPKKVGSTIITVTSQDGSKKASCTVTVTNASSDNNNGNNNNSGNGNTNVNTGTNNNSNNSNDDTTASGSLPQTGISPILISVIVSLVGISAVIFIRLRKYRGI